MNKRYITILVFCLVAFLPLHAKEFFGYTEDDPLVVVCDWDFRPYEFLDNQGRPAGYNVEVLSLIFKRLDIPVRFVLLEWSAAGKMFESQEADLIHALSFNYSRRPYVMTQKYVNYYQLKAVRKSSTPPFPGLKGCGEGDVIGMKPNDYGALYVQTYDSVPYRVEYLSPRDGLTQLNSGRLPYYIWGQLPLQRKIQELHLDSLVMDETGIPPGQLSIIGYDKTLVDYIDDTYTRLEQEGELQRINDKWFHPERIHDDASPVAIFIISGLAVAVVVILLLSRLIARRVKAAVSRRGELNNMMVQALKMGDYYVLEYDFQTGMVHNAYGRLLPDGGISEAEFVQRIDAATRDDFRRMVDQMKRGECNAWTMRQRWNAGTLTHPVWREYDGNAILERVDGEPRYIVHTVRDITRDVEEEQHIEELGAKYRKAFDTNMVAMSFYDREGRLIDLNQKMRELCEFNDERERFFREGLLFDNPFVKPFFEQGSQDTYHVCGHMVYPELGLDKYIESRIQPLVDESGELVYYIVVTRDVTGERDMYMRQREHDRQLETAHESINHYERQLRYLLEESNMFVWNFDLQTRVIHFSRTLREAEFSETIDEYLAGMADDHREEATRVMHEKVGQGQPFSVIHFFNYTPVSHQPTWCSIGGIPVHDDEGRLTGYFGIVRNITDLMSAQQKLREETARAEDSGRLKSAFLANMTHEIRTPLNAIVGFSELLQMVDTPEERMEFIRIIRNNCDMLLRLINDILEASNMNQSLAIKPEAVDLSGVFDDICQTLAQRVQEPGVEFQKDNPYDTCPAVLDKGRVQQLLTNFVTNAVKYTHEGHIKVGYRLQGRKGASDQPGLYFYCEDTGAGIPKEKQAAVFERFVKLNDFVQGTGLGLSICKAIVEHCDGDIGVTSAGEGHGSTFWFWIPQASE